MTADSVSDARTETARCPTRWTTRVTALALAVLALSLVAIAQREQGVARDEVVYMSAGDKYAAWWVDLVTGAGGTVTEQRITAHFGGARATDNNREHPPLLKTLFGLSRLVVHDALGWTRLITAYRLPSAAMGALLVALVFLFVCGVWGYAEAVLAALLALFLPRAMFHAGLAGLDCGITAMWFAALVAYHRALASRWWCIGLGVVFGLALASKHNAVMLPAVFAAHFAWLAIRALRASRAARTADASGGSDGSGNRAWPRLERPLLALAGLALGPLVLVAVWPWLWFDTLAHLADWMRFHSHHVHYNYEYLGHNWNAPPYPWHVPIVTTLLTVPVATLAAAAVGAGFLAVWARRGRARDADRAPALLLFLSAGVAMGPFLLTTTPIFGGEKHWAPAIPTICVFAGVGVVAAARLAAAWLAARLELSGLRTRLRAEPAAIAAAVTIGLGGGLVVTAAAIESCAAHPYALSHYNALAGGAPGGADLGMNRQFWGYAARGVLPVLADHAPGPGQPAVPVYTHDASPAWGLYRREGLLAPGLPDAGHEAAGIARSRLALVIHERHFNRHDYMIWSEYGTVQPVYVLTVAGVPIVSVYARPPPRAP